MPTNQTKTAPAPVAAPVAANHDAVRAKAPKYSGPITISAVSAEAPISRTAATLHEYIALLRPEVARFIQLGKPHTFGFNIVDGSESFLSSKLRIAASQMPEKFSLRIAVVKAGTEEARLRGYTLRGPEGDTPGEARMVVTVGPPRRDRKAEEAATRVSASVPGTAA
jgi:hypothetical protein